MSFEHNRVIDLHSNIVLVVIRKKSLSLGGPVDFLAFFLWLLSLLLESWYHLLGGILTAVSVLVSTLDVKQVSARLISGGGITSATNYRSLR